MNKNTDLEVKYDPQIIKLLGIQLYKQFPAVLNELMTNSYDSGASEVKIVLDKNNKSFSVSDNGKGMSVDDLQNKYLVIGRNRRSDEANNQDEIRPVTGKKGVGKLAPFGIAGEIKITTTKDGITNCYVLSLEKIMASSIDQPYHPEKVDVPNEKYDGTTIQINEVTLNNFSRRNIKHDAQSLARRFHNFSDDFKVTIEDSFESIELTNDLYFDSFEKEFIWNIPEVLSELSVDNDLLPLANKFHVTGQIFTQKTPIKDTSARGIFLYSRGKMASEAGFFEARDNEQFHTYATGYLNIDWIDNDPEIDAINTARQGVNWGINDDFQELDHLLIKLIGRINRSWRKKRKNAKREELYDVINSGSNREHLQSIQLRINKDVHEKNRFDKIQDTLAEIITNNDDSALQTKLVNEMYDTSKPARQDASPYSSLLPTDFRMFITQQMDILKNGQTQKSDENEQVQENDENEQTQISQDNEKLNSIKSPAARLVPQTLTSIDKSKGNDKIQKILSEVNEPIMADREDEFINAESLLLRGLIDATTSAYLENHFDLFMQHISDNDPHDSSLYILQEAQKWFDFHKKTGQGNNIQNHWGITPNKIQHNFNFADKYKTACRLLKIDGQITLPEKNNFINAIEHAEPDQNNAVQNLNLAMHSPIGMINFSELKEHWQNLSGSLQKMIEAL